MIREINVCAVLGNAEQWDEEDDESDDIQIAACTVQQISHKYPIWYTHEANRTL